LAILLKLDKSKEENAKEKKETIPEEKKVEKKEEPKEEKKEEKEEEPKKEVLGITLMLYALNAKLRPSLT